MSDKNMNTKYQTIIMRYVDCLYSLCEQENCVDEIHKNLDTINQYCVCNKLEKDIKFANISFKIASQLIEKLDNLIGLNKICKNFLLTLAYNKKFIHVLDICYAFDRLYREKNGFFLAKVISAKKFDEKQKGSLLNALRKLIDKKIELEFEVDEKLISGFQIQNGCKVLDLSLESKLKRLETEMTR